MNPHEQQNKTNLQPRAVQVQEDLGLVKYVALMCLFSVVLFIFVIWAS